MHRTRRPRSVDHLVEVADLFVRVADDDELLFGVCGDARNSSKSKSTSWISAGMMSPGALNGAIV
ncbi:hypothetical protein D8S78_23580 [Natrialba swarupiae]|nr:hypothetical protein [Natrialba swarupiae]